MAADRTVVIDAFPHRAGRHLGADAAACIDVDFPCLCAAAEVRPAVA